MPIARESEGPKYQTLAKLFKSRIQKGELKPGDRLPSFTEMRAQFGATPTTVERIYSQLEQDGLITRERGRGTFVRQPDSRPLTGIVGINGMVFHKHAHPYWDHLLEGVHEMASKNGYELLLLNAESAINWEKVDGVITHELMPVYLDAMLSRMPANMPCVGVLFDSRHFACVLADDYQGGYDMASHLISQGHRRIGYLANYFSITTRRIAGYKDALRDAGIEGDESWVRQMELTFEDNTGIDFLRAATNAMRHWLETGWHELGLTALMSQNDDTAIGAIRTLNEHGIRVPDDVSVAGFDGTEIARYFSPELTTVEVPLREIGAVAFETVLRQIRGEVSGATKMMLPTRISAGLSTRAV